MCPGSHCVDVLKGEQGSPAWGCGSAKIRVVTQSLTSWHSTALPLQNSSDGLAQEPGLGQPMVRHQLFGEKKGFCGFWWFIDALTLAGCLHTV